MAAITALPTTEATVPVTSPTGSVTARRLAALRALAETEPIAAQDAVWSWLQRVGAELPGAAAELELAELFALGTAADVDGQTAGLLVGWCNPSGLDRGGSVVYNVARWAVTLTGIMPWVGKKFDKAAGRGTNTMTVLAPILVKLIAPRYRMRRVGRYWEGFAMLNRVEESVVSPGTQVLVLDYEADEVANPYPINRIRDEAVELVPGTYLGAKIWHQPDGYRQLAYWAAKARVG